MKCTCGTASVGGKCASWCDSNLTATVLEDPPKDEQDDPFFSFQMNSFPGYVYKSQKYYQLKAPTTQKTIEDAVLVLFRGITITEDQMKDLKNKFLYNSYTTNGKEVVSFITQLFEEL